MFVLHTIVLDYTILYYIHVNHSSLILIQRLNNVQKLLHIPGTEVVYECDLVFLAMGYMGPEKELLDQLGLKKDARSNIETPIGKYSTNHPKVYAAGGGLLFLLQFFCMIVYWFCIIEFMPTDVSMNSVFIV